MNQPKASAATMAMWTAFVADHSQQHSMILARNVVAELLLFCCWFWFCWFIIWLICCAMAMPMPISKPGLNHPDFFAAASMALAAETVHIDLGFQECPCCCACQARLHFGRQRNILNQNLVTDKPYSPNSGFILPQWNWKVRPCWRPDRAPGFCFFTDGIGETRHDHITQLLRHLFGGEVRLRARYLFNEFCRIRNFMAYVPNARKRIGRTRHRATWWGFGAPFVVCKVFVFTKKMSTLNGLLKPYFQPMMVVSTGMFCVVSW